MSRREHALQSQKRSFEIAKTQKRCSIGISKCDRENEKAEMIWHQVASQKCKLGLRQVMEKVESVADCAQMFECWMQKHPMHSGCFVQTTQEKATTGQSD